MPHASSSHESDPGNEKGMRGVVHDLQYIEDEIGEMRRRTSVVKGGMFGSRRRSSVPA